MADKAAENEDADPYLELLHEMVEKLPREKQELYRMRYIDDMTQLEIGDVLGISQNSARKQLVRLEAKLTAMCREAMGKGE